MLCGTLTAILQVSFWLALTHTSCTELLSQHYTTQSSAGPQHIQCSYLLPLFFQLPTNTFQIPSNANSYPYHVYCESLKLPEEILHSNINSYIDLPPTNFKDTADLCYANPTTNAACHCKKINHFSNPKLVCPESTNFVKPSQINAYCNFACSCFLGGPIDDGFRPPDHWFQQPRCVQKVVDGKGEQVMGLPIYCTDDEDCGYLCSCNKQEDDDSADNISRKLILRVELPAGLGVCGPKRIMG